MKKELIRTAIKIIAGLELLGGIVCLFGGVSLLRSRPKIISVGQSDLGQLNRLAVYIWLSCAVSFILVIGLIRRKEWARKLLLIFAAFGLANTFLKIFPFLSDLFAPRLGRGYSWPFIILDILLLYFFSRQEVKKEFE